MTVHLEMSFKDIFKDDASMAILLGMYLKDIYLTDNASMAVNLGMYLKDIFKDDATMVVHLEMSFKYVCFEGRCYNGSTLRDVP